MPIYHTASGPVEALEWGDGPTLILLLHAAAAGPASLSGLAKALATPGRRIVAPALHGYGGTRITDAADPFEAHAAVARAVLDLYPARRRVLFGHSMGGLVALAAAATTDAIIVYEPIVIGLLRDDDPADVAARDWDRAIVGELERQIAAGDLEAGIRVFIEAWNETAWDALPAAVRARLVAAAPAMAREIRAGSSRQVDPGGIVAPLLILQGSASPAITAAMTARLHAAVPGSHRMVLDGSGHMGPVQAAGFVAAAIESTGLVENWPHTTI
jgi:pimeloyl-ACP methyl ester carboxylesterase